MTGEVFRLFDVAARLARDYGLRRAAIVEATQRAAREWQGRGEDPAVIDSDTDTAFAAAVLDELRAAARRRAN